MTESPLTKVRRSRNTVDWKQNNKNRVKQKNQEWLQKNKARVRKTSKAYRLSHPEQFREYRKKSGEKLRNQVLEILGNKCVKCGFLDRRALQIDHIHGGGHKERKLVSYRTIYRFIRNNPKLALEKYQLLCANCNAIKRHFQGE